MTGSSSALSPPGLPTSLSSSLSVVPDATRRGSGPERLKAAAQDYEAVFVAARAHPLAARPFVVAEDFRGETLITYPVERERLDVFSQVLMPAGVVPREVRQVELTAVILMLVASNRGVAVLPDWVVRAVRANPDYVTLPLTAEGVTRRLYAATRTVDLARPYLGHFLRLARSEPVKLQRG